MWSKIETREVETTILELRRREAVACDQISSALKAFESNAIVRLTNIVNKIYDTGI